ncbi:unnamed protein product, partial [Tetraodon nigroviridis]
ADDTDTMSSAPVGISDLSDEILLCILRHVPVCDLLMNVARVCNKFHTLCHDKTLLSNVNLSEDYLANNQLFRKTLKQLANHVQSLSLNGCYWLAGCTVDVLACCRGVTHLDVTGCRLSSLRLSRLLSSLSLLRSLAFDVKIGFNLTALSSEAVDTLSRLSELRQTLMTPSYGVVPCCAQLRKLMLQFDISDVTKEGVGVSCQLMVSQSSVPHYQQLEEFTARLAPGEANQTLLLLYLAVFSVHVPKHLRVFLVSIPGPNPVRWPAAASLAQSLGQRGDLEALQLPRTWLDFVSLSTALEGNSPKRLSFSRCPAIWPQVLQSLTEGGVKDAAQLSSLNLSGINQVLYSDTRSAEDHLASWTVSRLAECCYNVKHLNLMHTHYHHQNTTRQEGESHLCASLAKFRRLRSLTLPACALSDGVNAPQISVNRTSPSALLLGLKRTPRMGLPNYKTDSDSASTAGLTQLVAGCLRLESLELIGPGFVSVLPRLEPCGRASVEPRGMCAWAHGVGDPHLATLAGLTRLRCLTLAGLPGVQKGTGLTQLAKQCKDLRVLSLANLGSLKMMDYTSALLDTLKQCTQLQELRLEQPYLNANALFFEALSCCSRLRRLCLISRGGTFDPAAMETFMVRCGNVIMCHMFMGGTLVACRTLQKALLD